MSEPSSLYYIIDSDFQNYDSWDGDTLTFTYAGQNYTVGLNAFTDFESALAAKGDADATFLVASEDIPFGDYDNNAPASWNGRLDIKADSAQSLELSPVCINGQIALDNASLAFGLISQQGSLTLSNNSTLILAYHLGTSFNQLENLTIHSGSRLADKGKLGAGFTLRGNNAASGTQTAARSYDDALPTLSAQKGAVLAENATLTLASGAVANFKLATLGNGSRVTLQNAHLNIDGALEMQSGSDIAMDADSLLTVNGITSNGGTITVDATGFVGYRKVVDVSGFSNPEKEVQVVNAAENVTALHLQDGDLILTTADMSTYLIDTSWKDSLAMGDLVDSSGDFIFCVNAFDAYDTAYANARTMSPKQKIKLVNGTTTLSQSNILTDLYIQNGSTLTTDDGDFVFGGDDAEDAPLLNVEAGSTLDGSASSFTLRSNAHFNLEGTEDAPASVSFNDGSNPCCILSLQDAAFITAAYADISLASLALQSVDTSATFSDSSVLLGSDLQNGTYSETLTDGKPTLTLTRSTLNVNGAAESANYGAIVLADNSDLRLNNANHARFKNLGSITLQDSNMHTIKDMLNNGMLALENSDLDMRGTLSNSRSISATAKSSLRLNAMENSGSLFLHNSDSSISTNLKNIGTITLENASISVDDTCSNGNSITLNVSVISVKRSFVNDAETTASGSNVIAYNLLTNNGSMTLKETTSMRAEDLVNTGCLDLSQCIATINGGVTNSNSILMKKAYLLVDDDLENSGTINAKDSTITVDGTMENTGTLDFDRKAQLTFGAFAGENGSLTVDLTGITEEIRKLIDITGTDAHSLEDFGNITFSDSRYTPIAYQNDLYACNLETVRVDTSWTAETALPYGFYWGLNAFNDLNEAVKQTAGNTLKYEFTYNNPDYDNALAIFNATPVSGDVTITYKNEGTTLASYQLTKATTEKFDIERGTTYIIAFDGEPSQYGLRLSLLDDHKNHREALDYSETNYGYVAPETGPKEYELTVEDGTSGEYTFSVGGMDCYVNYSIIDTATKSTLYSGSQRSGFSFSKCLTKGSYLVTVSCFDTSNAYYSTDFTVTVSATVFSDVTDEDDAIAAKSLASMKTMSTSQSAQGFVGLGDARDWLRLDLGDASGTYDIFLNTEEGSKATGLQVQLVQATSATATETVAKANYYGNSAAPIFNDITLNASKTYYLKVEASNDETTANNATYTASMAIVALNPYLDNDDDAFNADTVQDTPYNGGTFQNWLGEEDTLDWLKIEAGTVSGAGEIATSSNGGTLKTTLYRTSAGKTSGALQQVDSWLTYSGRTSGTDVTFAAGYDYYVQFQLSSSYGETSYAMSIA